MLHLLRKAVDPTPGLRRCVENWDEISFDLRESPRERRLQMEELAEEEALLS